MTGAGTNVPATDPPGAGTNDPATDPPGADPAPAAGSSGAAPRVESPGDAPAGVLLAAGAGTRFGGPKALAQLDGEPLATRGVRTLRTAGCVPVVVVLGAQAERVRAEVDLAAADVVVNPDWETGIASSLVAGLRALRGRAPAAVVALVDQPQVTAVVVERLVAAWQGGATAAVATYEGAPRNPVVLDASVWDDVAATVRGDEGARSWLRANVDRVVHVECGALGSAADVDTPADLASLAERGDEPGG